MVIARPVETKSPKCLAFSQPLKTGARYKRPAVARNDSWKLIWNSSSGDTTSITSPVSSSILRASRSLSRDKATKARAPMMAERITGGTQPASRE